MKKILLIVVLVLLFINTKGQVNHYLSKDLNLIFIERGYSYIVPYTASTFDNAMSFHKKFWDYTPSEDVTILLNDFSDVGNGGTLVIPWNFISANIAPFEYTFDIMPANERLQWLMSHELAHVVMCDKASSTDKFYRSVLGGKTVPEQENPVTMIYSYLTTPRWYSPRWYHEGIAVFMETWMSGGMGRVLGGYDEMVFRTMVLDSSYFYRVVGLETEGTTIDFQVGVNSYLYGTRFVSYLANKYGVDKVREFFDRSNNSKRFYASQFENVFNIDVEDEWENWINFEKDFQNKNLELIRKNPVSNFKQITKTNLGSVSRPYYDKDTRSIIAALNYPKNLARICKINIDNGEISKITDVNSPNLYFVTNIAYDDSTKQVFFSENNSDWRNLNVCDINGNDREELIEYSRLGDLVINKNDHTLWGVQTNNGRTMIVYSEPPYKELKTVYGITFGTSIFDLDISADGKKLSCTMSKVSGEQELVYFNIDSLFMGSTNYTKVYEFEDNSASNFMFSPDGKYLIGTSYYTGVSNVYRINIETKALEILTNSESGYFRPLPISNDSLIVFRYTTEGLTPELMKITPLEDVNSINYLGQKVIEKNPIVESWMLPPPRELGKDEVKEKKYGFVNEMRFASAYPIVQGYKDFAAFGYQIKFMDPIGISALNMSVLYSPNKLIDKKERIHAFASYKYWDWTFSGSYNRTDFYDLFGPTKTSRAGYEYSIKYNHIFNAFRPYSFDYSIKLAGYGDLETIPGYQNVAASYSKLYSGLINISYSKLRKSIGAIEPEQGYALNLYGQDYYVNKKQFPKVYTTLDFGTLLPFKNSSLWLRTAAGHSFGITGNPFDNFYFGGFGNNYVDYQNVQRYREFESFPGLEINEVGSKNFAKGTLEFNLSPIRFRKFGFLSFYTTYMRLSIFGMALSTNIDEKSLNRNLFNYGAQVDFELVLFSLLKSNLSFGYARAHEKSFTPKDEFMISLKLL